jgi:hypothetical protein
MPLYEYTCINGHSRDTFLHSSNYLSLSPVICECGETMTRRLSMGRGLTWFEEGRPRVIENMGVYPVTITSHEQHKRLMRERNLEWVPPSRGMPGCWG